MSGPAVLIAGFSGRALAQSARRAGYRPFVVDACGDEDMRAAAHGFRVLAGAMRRGFRAKSLVAALECLSAEAGDEPIGLVLGSGFEDQPALIERLARQFKLLSCSADVVRRVKDPQQLFPLLDRLGVAHPETGVAPPSPASGWLSKLIGGSGGTHIVRCRAGATGRAGRYFQRHESGSAVSMAGVISNCGTQLGISRQWLAPMPRRPFRFGGAAGPCELGGEASDAMLSSALLVAREAGVCGLCSFDFLLTDDGPLLLEVNPRPTATLDVFDDATGTLFDLHVNHFAGSSANGSRNSLNAPGAKAIGYLYADEGAVEVGATEWPDWVADRPMPGTVIERWRPIATVIADGETPELAQELCRKRLGQLERMVYGPKIREEP